MQALGRNLALDGGVVALPGVAEGHFLRQRSRQVIAVLPLGNEEQRSAGSNWAEARQANVKQGKLSQLADEFNYFGSSVRTRERPGGRTRRPKSPRGKGGRAGWKEEFDDSSGLGPACRIAVCL